MNFKLALAVFAFLVLTAAAHAQGGSVSSGCDSSPENPTAILALAGSAGAFFAIARDRWRRK